MGTILVLLFAAGGSFLFATLGYALRDFSRATLAAWFEARGKLERLEPLLEREDELALTSSIVRAAFNLVAILGLMHLLTLLMPDASGPLIFTLTFICGLAFLGIVGVALPLVIAEYAAEPFIGMFSRLLQVKRVVLLPVVRLHGPLDALVRRATGHGPADDPEEVEEELEQEILDIVAEGREEGVIDEAERQMIERAIRFQDTTAGQVMTARSELVGLPVDAAIEQVLEVFDESGYSRIPVYAGSLDKVIGILYARDLFRYVGKRVNGHTSDDGTTQAFRVRKVMRQPLFVPKTKPLADLLRDFQHQKVHMAVVMDEYGGTAGLVTIEDVLEELVGEIEDEHEYDESPTFRRLDEHAAEADGRAEVVEINRLMSLGLPEDEGYTTVGGFVTTTLGTIPQPGASFEHTTADGRRAVFTVLDAEPQRVTRVRIDVRPGGAARPQAADAADPPEAEPAPGTEAPAAPSDAPMAAAPADQRESSSEQPRSPGRRPKVGV